MQFSATGLVREEGSLIDTPTEASMYVPLLTSFAHLAIPRMPPRLRNTG